MQNRTRLPPAGSGSADKTPPCITTSWRARCRPTPSPARSLRRTFSAVTNGSWNALVTMSRGTPTPESVTENCTPSDTRRSDTSTRPLGGENRQAFSTSWAMAWAMRLRSASTSSDGLM